jgi:membrane-bound lytic murein transglycosylase F
MVASATLSPAPDPAEVIRNDSKLQSIESQSRPQNGAPAFGPPYVKLVKEYAARYGVDYRLVLALVRQESRFDAEAVSNRGAFGLMQIMPPTGSEISERLELPNLHSLRGNLHGGVYYFSRIMTMFPGLDEESRLRLSLAAYFAGPARIYDAQDIAAYMGQDPTSWRTIKGTLPLLSKRYYSLHQAVWEGGRPRNGYFRSWRATLSYVDNVMENYKDYQRRMD